jgi:PAS domain S-box-containing protein
MLPLMAFWRRSLTGRALLFTAAAVGLVIVAATAITYRFVFEGVEARSVRYLNQYVSERARREEQNFLRIRDSLNIARQAFVERWRAPDPPGYLDRFDRLFAKDPDGAVRSRREFGDNFKFPTLWIHKDRLIDDDFKRRILVLYDTTALFLPIWIHSLGSLYATTPDTANIGFETALPNWIYDAPADLDQDSMDYVALLSPASNPTREMKWLAPGYADPNTGQYFVTLALPVDVDGRHVATFGHDMIVQDLFAKTVQTDVVGLTHMVLREDGRVIAHPDLMPAIVARKGLYTIEDSGDPAFISLCHAMFAAKGREISGFDRLSNTYYAATRIEEAGWIFASTMPRGVVTAQAFESTRWVLWSGLLSLGLELALLAIVLQRQIARPMRAMLAATRRIAAGESYVPLVADRADELGELASGFNEMVHRVQERDEALRLEKASLERRVAQRTVELRESAERLSQSEERFRTAFHASPAIQCLMRASDGLIVDVNAAFSRVSGYDAAEVLGRTAAELDFVAMAELLADVAANGAVSERELVVRTRSGRFETVLVSGEMIEIDHEPHLLIASLAISAIKAAERELLHALAREKELSDMKSDFVSIVSHEFRTPLEVIMSSGDILERYFDRLDAGQRRGHLQAIHESVRRMDGLMTEVLLLSTVEAGRMQCAPAPLDLAALCRRIIDEIRSATSHRNPIALDVAAALPEARADESLLRHILTNLLANAVKYSPAGAPVTLAIGRDAGIAVVRVIDRGCGIPADDRDRLFHAFFRARNARHVPGTGLGLVIVRRCVELHGGAIAFDSEEDRGTTFTVRLPLFDGAEPA